MNKRNIERALQAKLKDWLEHIDNEYIKDLIRQNAMVSGGAIVSLVNGEKPNDYDIYFKTKEATMEVAKYYAEIWNNELNKGKKIIVVDTNELIANDAYHATYRFPDRIECLIDNGTYNKSGRAGEIRNEELLDMMAMNDNESGIDDKSEPIDFNEPEVHLDKSEADKDNKMKYRPRYFSTNAITLSDGIQIVIRFWGPIEEIHQNFDFLHCKGNYDFATNTLNISNETLFAIINKELIYQGSKYPLCSIIRTRKFITRGYTINAGQYVKMALELQELDLKDLKTFKDQLIGVDSLYFAQMIGAMTNKRLSDPDFDFTGPYLIEIINRIFG